MGRRPITTFYGGEPMGCQNKVQGDVILVSLWLRGPRACVRYNLKLNFNPVSTSAPSSSAIGKGIPGRGALN